MRKNLYYKTDNYCGTLSRKGNMREALITQSEKLSHCFEQVPKVELLTVASFFFLFLETKTNCYALAESLLWMSLTWQDKGPPVELKLWMCPNMIKRKVVHLQNSFIQSKANKVCLTWWHIELFMCKTMSSNQTKHGCISFTNGDKGIVGRMNESNGYALAHNVIS